MRDEGTARPGRVADEDFDFGVRERREAKRFEPPPWERDQFEELARQKAEREAAEAETRARAVAEAEAAAGVEAQEQAVTAEPGADEEEPATGGAGTEPVAATGLEEARVTEMLADLAVQEPPAARALWKVSVAIGGVMIAFGAVFVFWGMAALVAVKRTGAVGTFGGSVLLLFGAGFIGGGLYIALKNLRQQGVL